MKKIINFLRHLFRVQYRLSIIYRGEGQWKHIYGTDGQMLRRRAKTLEKDLMLWSLYKEGPFGIKEREVDYYLKGDLV